MAPEEIIKYLVQLRKRRGVSLRELARRADVAPASLSAIEKGRSSPTLATLHKLLNAMGTDFASFVSGLAPQSPGSPVYGRADMQTLSDKHRTYTFLFPKRDDLKLQMVHEVIRVSEKESEWEAHRFDLGCLLLEGGPLRLEIDGVGSWAVNAGDAFYVKQGRRHRATNVGQSDARLVSTMVPPLY
jgi:transcriptional regulator with XRE-family HTH domain